MSVDISLVNEHREIEDSLLDDSNIVATLTHEGQFIRPEESPSDAEHGESVFDDPMDYFAEALYEQEHDAQKLGDEGLAGRLQEEGARPETGQHQAEQAERQPQAERQAPSEVEQ